MGEGCVKNPEKLPTSFMDGPNMEFKVVRYRALVKKVFHFWNFKREWSRSDFFLKIVPKYLSKI